MKLHEYLEQNGLTQSQFGDGISRSQQAVARYCAGRIPDPETMRLIIEATNRQVTPNDFYGVVAA